MKAKLVCLGFVTAGLLAAAGMLHLETANNNREGVPVSVPLDECIWLEITEWQTIVDLLEFCVVNGLELEPPQRHGDRGMGQVKAWRRCIAIVAEAEASHATNAKVIRAKMIEGFAWLASRLSDNDDQIRKKVQGGAAVWYRALNEQLVRIQSRRKILMSNTECASRRSKDGAFGGKPNDK